MTLAAEITEAKDQLRDARDQAVNATDQAEVKLDELRVQIEALESNTVPDEIEGTVEGYQFGVSAEDMHPNGNGTMPTHRFELNCGNQVWLHIVLGSDKWDEFVSGCGLSEEDMEGTPPAELWNGKRLKMRRDPAYGRFVPVELMENPSKPAGTDRNGVALYDGDTVTLVDDGLTLVVRPPQDGGVFERAYGEGYVQGEREDGLPGAGDPCEGYAGDNLFIAESSAVEKAPA